MLLCKISITYYKCNYKSLRCVYLHNSYLFKNTKYKTSKRKIKKFHENSTNNGREWWNNFEISPQRRVLFRINLRIGPNEFMYIKRM